MIASSDDSTIAASILADISAFLRSVMSVSTTTTSDTRPSTSVGSYLTA